DMIEKYAYDTCLIGDDLYVSQGKKLWMLHEKLKERGLVDKDTNKLVEGLQVGILIKLNQNGYLTTGVNEISEESYMGTLEVIYLAKKLGYKIIISHRSKEADGEDNEVTIAHLSAVHGDMLKSGDPKQLVRRVKENEQAFIQAMDMNPEFFALKSSSQGEQDVEDAIAFTESSLGKIIKMGLDDAGKIAKRVEAIKDDLEAVVRGGIIGGKETYSGLQQHVDEGVEGALDAQLAAKDILAQLKAIVYGKIGSLVVNDGEKRAVVLPYSEAIGLQLLNAKEELKIIEQKLGIVVIAHNDVSAAWEQLTSDGIKASNIFVYADKSDVNAIVDGGQILATNVLSINELTEGGYLPVSRLALLGKAMLLRTAASEGQKYKYESPIQLIWESLTGKKPNSAQLDKILNKPWEIILEVIYAPAPSKDLSTQQRHEAAVRMWA
ncbi:MAG: hypothetical protein ABIB11_01500, partial [Candidatus Omnitrophota bacterium]